MMVESDFNSRCHRQARVDLMGLPLTRLLLTFFVLFPDVILRFCAQLLYLSMLHYGIGDVLHTLNAYCQRASARIRHSLSPARKFDDYFQMLLISLNAICSPHLPQ
ncbi:hypothetical protein Tcan_08089 [Toxocara canis]|uniref:Uncharacterized protein n=1 Tax=Toxocara canis TaxID=6265 RepID=A0A0B2UQT7_TOXCA|nr:hypothetical protein Tcan_08089 [Toxocara canis]